MWALLESEIESAPESVSLMMEYEAATEEIPQQQCAGIVITLEKVAIKNRSRDLYSSEVQ